MWLLPLWNGSTHKPRPAELWQISPPSASLFKQGHLSQTASFSEALCSQLTNKKSITSLVVNPIRDRNMRPPWVVQWSKERECLDKRRFFNNCWVGGRKNWKSLGNRPYLHFGVISFQTVPHPPFLVASFKLFYSFVWQIFVEDLLCSSTVWGSGFGGARGKETNNLHVLFRLCWCYVDEFWRV